MGNNNNNTSLLFLMLMIVLLFFMLKPHKKPQTQSATKTEQTASAQSAISQPLMPGAAAELAAVVKAHGQQTADGVFALANEMVNLKAVPADSLNPVTGTIVVGNDTLDVAAILNDRLAGATPEKADMARKTVAGFISNYNRFKSFAPFLYGKEEKVELKNDLITMTLSNKGGMIEKAVLNKYLNENTEPATDVVLFDAATGSYNFTFVTAEQRIHTDSLYFRPVEVSDTSVTMALPLAQGVDWKIRYTLRPGEYLVKMEILQQGIDAVIPMSTATIDFDWKQRMGRNEVGRTFEDRNSALIYKYVGQSPKELDSQKTKREDLNSRVKWVAFKNQFFSSVIIANSAPFASAQVYAEPLKNSPNYVKYMTMSSTLPYSLADGCPASFYFYLGPNDYPLLSKLDSRLGADEDLDLNRLVPLGWGLFRWINQLIVIPVFSFLSKFTHNYGIIILLLTIFIKLILFPFTWKSFKSQAKMRVLAPEIKEINEKYPGDENAMKRQQETMALYTRVGASPLSGCLPMMLQMPVLIAMFAFFPSAIELRGQSFLWAHDLSAPDYICKLPFTIPWYGNHVSLFCLLMTVTNVIYTYLTAQSQPTGATGPMKWMMYLMPVMFLFFFNDYASGLSYYYFLSLLITIIQTWIFRKCINEKKVREEMLENAKKPKKKTGFMARLQEMQKQQEAMMREQARQNAKKRR